jgi:hypothetical protein
VELVNFGRSIWQKHGPRSPVVSLSAPIFPGLIVAKKKPAPRDALQEHCFRLCESFQCHASFFSAIGRRSVRVAQL